MTPTLIRIHALVALTFIAGIAAIVLRLIP